MPQQPALPGPEAPLLPPAPQNLPIAHTPFSSNWPVHNMGSMNVKCPYCHALHWKEERLSKSSLQNPKFGKCCLSGKIWLPTLDQPPLELHNLLTSQDPRAKGFHTNIRKYNDALVMTSVGCDLLPMEGGGPYVFKVYGSLSHQAGSLLPAPNQPPVYAQLYIYDPDDALTYRMDNPHRTGPSWPTFKTCCTATTMGCFVQISNGNDQKHAFWASVQNQSSLWSWHWSSLLQSPNYVWRGCSGYSRNGWGNVK